MGNIKIRGGHRFRLKHGPSETLVSRLDVETIAIVPRGYIEMKAKVSVKEGETVEACTVLFFNKKNPDVRFTSPVSGKVIALNYGERRTLLSVVIKRDQKQKSIDFKAVAKGDVAGLGREKVSKKLVEAGLWNRFVGFPSPGVAPVPGRKPKTDAHGHTPPEKILKAVYVSALSTEPHQPSPFVVLEGQEEIFAAGLEAVKQLAPKTYLFVETGKKLPASAAGITGVLQQEITPKYPASSIGVQVYYTERLAKNEFAASLGVQDIIDIGYLFLNGCLNAERIICISGNQAKEKQHLKVLQGSKISDLIGFDDDQNGRLRFISGGLFNGVKVAASDYLGVNEHSLAIMEEDHKRTPLHFQLPHLGAFSLLRTFFSGFSKNTQGDPTTSQNGEERACIQCGACIDVCPVELMPNIIFKAALNKDLERMEQVSINDCVDCGLCTFICPSKIEIDQHIEDGKLLILKEG